MNISIIIFYVLLLGLPVLLVLYYNSRKPKPKIKLKQALPDKTFSSRLSKAYSHTHHKTTANQDDTFSNLAMLSGLTQNQVTFDENPWSGDGGGFSGAGASSSWSDSGSSSSSSSCSDSSSSYDSSCSSDY